MSIILAVIVARLNFDSRSHNASAAEAIDALPATAESSIHGPSIHRPTLSTDAGSLADLPTTPPVIMTKPGSAGNDQPHHVEAILSSDEISIQVQQAVKQRDEAVEQHTIAVRNLSEARRTYDAALAAQQTFSQQYLQQLSRALEHERRLFEALRVAPTATDEKSLYASQPTTTANPRYRDLQIKLQTMTDLRTGLVRRLTPTHPQLLEFDTQIFALRVELDNTPTEIPWDPDQDERRIDPQNTSFLPSAMQQDVQSRHGSPNIQIRRGIETIGRSTNSAGSVARKAAQNSSAQNFEPDLNTESISPALILAEQQKLATAVQFAHAQWSDAERVERNLAKLVYVAEQGLARLLSMQTAREAQEAAERLAAEARRESGQLAHDIQQQAGKTLADARELMREAISVRQANVNSPSGKMPAANEVAAETNRFDNIWPPRSAATARQTLGVPPPVETKELPNESPSVPTTNRAESTDQWWFALVVVVMLSFVITLWKQRANKLSVKSANTIDGIPAKPTPSGQHGAAKRRWLLKSPPRLQPNTVTSVDQIRSELDLPVLTARVSIRRRSPVEVE